MKISVIIPCRNEKPFIEECVRAVFSSELDHSIQLSVFVVDGMSDDGTREILLSLQDEFNNLNLVDNIKQLTPFAFNLGIYADLQADYFQIIGARHIISSNYIAKSLAVLKEKPEVWCVGGRVINDHVNYEGDIISRAMSTSFGMGLGNFRTLDKSAYTDTVTSPMYPKFVFDKIGYFDEDLVRNQDDDFNYRVTVAGGKIWFENSIFLKYYVRGNYSGLWRQFYQYGYWKVFVNKKHNSVTTLRQLVPPAFVLFALFSIPLIVKGSKFLNLAIGLIWILYLCLGFSIAFKQEGTIKDKLNIHKTFFYLHFSYGLGYLKGILDFYIFNKKPDDKQKRLSR